MLLGHQPVLSSRAFALSHLFGCNRYNTAGFAYCIMIEYSMAWRHGEEPARVAQAVVPVLYEGVIVLKDGKHVSDVPSLQ